MSPSAYTVILVAIGKVWPSLGHSRIDRLTVSTKDCRPGLVYVSYAEESKLYDDSAYLQRSRVGVRTHAIDEELFNRHLC
jgi:hypothetical protein